MKKEILDLILILVLTFSLGACGPSDQASQDSPIIIGLIMDVSGPFISFGTDIKLATEKAIEDVNAAGGVNGSLLEIKFVDSQGNPDQAVIGIRELADAGAFTVSGPMSSGEAEVIFVQAGQLEIPIITGTANKEGITELGNGWAFRNTATNTAIYTTAIPPWANKYNLETALLIFDEAEPFAAAAAKFAIPGAAESVGLNLLNADNPITFAKGQTDFSTTVQRIKDTEADGLIIICASVEAGLIAREMVRQGETRPVLSHPAIYSSAFFEQGGDQINNWVIPTIFDPASTEEDTLTFIKVMKATDPEPPTVPEAANYYDNIMMFAEVMRTAGIDGSTPPEEARKAIQEGLLALSDFDGVAGNTTFAGNNDAEKAIYLKVVINGLVESLVP